jgi:two-component system NarL family sensor kinase
MTLVDVNDESMADRHALKSDTEQLRRRNRELSILNAIAQALNREVDLTRALHTALAQVAELLGLHTGWIWLLSEETGESYLAAAQNLPPRLMNTPRLMGGDCYCLRTYREGDLEGAANVNIVTCSRLKGLIGGTDGLRYHASIPLYAPNNKHLGVLNVASTDWRELSPEDLRLLYTVGDMLSIAIERVRLFERSTQLGAAEERNRLAREIHDTIAQGLTAISLQLESAEAFLEANADIGRARQAISEALALTRDNLEEARRSVLDLRAAPLEGRNLSEALSVLVEESAAIGAFEVDFEATGGGHPLPPRVETGLYRIAQEALTNIIQHSEARQVKLRLVATPTNVRLSIEDDGRGFDLDRVSQERYGLVGLNGTRIDVLVPLADEP